jgi:hypothetical protein
MVSSQHKLPFGPCGLKGFFCAQAAGLRANLRGGAVALAKINDDSSILET